MSGSPRILFVADAGPGVGAERVARCLTLAGALQAAGAGCVFVSPPAVEEVLVALAPAAERAPARDASPEALFFAAQATGFDAVVFDHDGMQAVDHQTLSGGRAAMAIDDRCDRPLGVNLVLNVNPERRADDYEGLLRADARTRMGPLHALVGPEFAALREGALARRAAPVRRVLVSVSVADPAEAVGRILDRVRSRIGEAALDITLSRASPARAGLERLARRDARLRLHIDPPDLPQMSADADIAVGVVGTEAWERCTLGLPTLLAITRPEQRPPAHAMAELEAALVADLDAPDFEGAFDRLLARLIRDPDLRQQLAAASARICDGHGAGRVAQAMLQLVRDTSPQAESVAD